ncbi:MAG: peroxisome assembly protein (Peroxin-2) [Trizodia sp. TS-e1964]|nr:MAG: peroxisome assembly protein (Peroxin-2) [Trizodia sp. TS-e1964]
MSSVDFSAAQQRLLARRQNQGQEAQARQATHQSTTAFHQLPFPLGRLSQNALRSWDAVKGREGTRPAFRVGQVDSELLDEELLELLKSQVGDSLKYFSTHLREEWSAEINFFLRAILFKLTMWDHNATYGAALQNLRYTDARGQSSLYATPSKWQKGLYGLFSVGGRYAWAKWEDWIHKSSIYLLSNISSKIYTSYSVLSFASFLIFLINGRYRTLVDRVLRMRLMPPPNQLSRQVSFEYLNRQLVWHAFTEFLLFILPLVGISRWRRWLSKGWRKARALTLSGEKQLEYKMATSGELSFLPERTCAICYQDQNPTSNTENDILVASSIMGGVIGSSQTDVTNPYESIPCGCIYCFVCLARRLESEEGEGWVCLKCGELAKECKPWNGDVLEESVNMGQPGKSVAFAEISGQHGSRDIESLEPATR